MIQLLIATVIGFTATQAHAEAFIYACEIVVDLRFETHLAKVDEQKHTFQWRGKTYRISNQPDCAKYGRAGEGVAMSYARNLRRAQKRELAKVRSNIPMLVRVHEAGQAMARLCTHAMLAVKASECVINIHISREDLERDRLVLSRFEGSETIANAAFQTLVDRYGGRPLAAYASAPQQIDLG